jgi:glutaconate CoA-transferase subunit B
MYDIFAFYLQRGQCRCRVSFEWALKSTALWKYQCTVIGEYNHPKVRLPGSAVRWRLPHGQIAVIFITPHQKRRFPEKVHFSAPGWIFRRKV